MGKGDVARRCEIYRLDLWLALGKAARPIIGYGVCRKGDSTKMEHLQCAMKRAEADALKRAYDLPFAVTEFETVMPETLATVTIEDDEVTAEDERSRAKQDAVDLFGASA